MRLVRYSYPAFRTTSPTFGFQRSPWAGLENEIDRFFETASPGLEAVNSSRFPVDLYEDKENTYVRATLPGVRREDIDIQVTDGVLTIAAVRKMPAADGKAARSLSFTRTVNVAENVQTDKVCAAYENGVLTVTLPKREEVKPRKITVGVK